MQKEKSYSELWSYFEYFLDFTSEGINLKGFNLIVGENKTPGTGDAYFYEKITRSVLAKNSGRIKQFVKKTIKTDKQEQTKTAAGAFQDSLRHNLYREIKNSLDARLIDNMKNQITADDTKYKILIMASLYYAYYKNSHIPGYRLELSYFTAFIPFLFYSQKNEPENIMEWQQQLQDKFLNSFVSDGEGNYNLRAFFEDEAVAKIMSLAFAGILSFMNKEKERALHFFEVGNDLKESHFKTFKMQIANGFYTSLEKEKRFFPNHCKEDRHAQSLGIKVIPKKLVLDIIESSVDKTFDKALMMIINYYQSIKSGRVKSHSLKKYDKAFLEMNRKIWQEIRKLIQTQKQVFYRTRYLLRIIVYYMFETRKIERDYWLKYIPSIEKLINYKYRDTNEKLNQFNKDLNKIIGRYREAELFQGTDWSGFYDDPASKMIAIQVLQNLVDKGSLAQDKNMPAPWFSSQVNKGVDDLVLFRFFRQGLKEIKLAF